MILSNNNINMVFNENSLLIDCVFLGDGTTVCTQGKQAVSVRIPKAASEPVLLSHTQLCEIQTNKIRIIFEDDSKKYQAEMWIESADIGIRFKMSVTAPEPIWLIEWKLTSIDVDEFIIPALGGQLLTRDMPDDMTLSYKYPFWWNSQFTIGNRESGGLWLFSRDMRPNLKLLRIGKHQDRFALSYGYEASAPLNSKRLEAEWYIDGFSGDWREPVDIHRKWLENAFDLKEVDSRLDRYPWAKNVNFVLEIWGARRDSEMPMHTFDQMIDRLHEWKTMHVPEQTLVYLPGFAENGIDTHIPNYNPSERCGGAGKFKELVDTAHDLGYRVMIHTNVLGMTYNHRLFPKFKEYQVVDCFERSQGWAMDLDGDWLAEPYFAYINPGVKAWGDLMKQVIGELVESYDIDAVFLDQTLLAFNDRNYPNFLHGMRAHIEELQASFPNVLFAGEGMHEHVLNPLSFAQIHGIDSVAEVHGMDGQYQWRQVHPVSTYLFGRYVKFVAHLLTRHPSHPIFRFQEASYAKLGVLPALCLYDHSQPIGTEQVSHMIERAKKIK